MRALQMGRALWLLCTIFLVSFLVSRGVASPAGNDDDDPTNGGKRPMVHSYWAQHKINELLYFDDSDVMLAVEAPENDGKVYRSTDLGVSWDPVEDLPEGQVAAIVYNRFANKVAVAIGLAKTHWMTKNRGESWTSFEIEGIPAFGQVPLLSFHSTNDDMVILNTRTKDGPQAIYTTDGFKTAPQVLRRDAIRCMWAKEQQHFTLAKAKSENLALCIAFGRYSRRSKDNRLVMSPDFFKNNEREPQLEGGRPASGIISLVAAKAFILAARQTPGTNQMALYVTTNAATWHRADFGDHQLIEGGYTVMESTNYSLQIDVAAGGQRVSPMGTLFSSNSLGYSFVKNEKYTNRNTKGFVDFEQVSGIQGICLVNVVENHDEVLKTGVPKKVHSKITFDDGRNFDDLRCGNEKLHLHSVTDQINVGKIFTSKAPGMVMGIGNTGSELDSLSRANLYVSDDAGKHWSKALEGTHLYEFGDQGSVLVAVYDETATGEIKYSLDHGDNWNTVPLKDYFPVKPHTISPSMLSTLPDSTSLKFHVVGSYGRGAELEHYILTIDFSKMKVRTCTEDDFEMWDAILDKDKKPLCIMGRTQKYRRRKKDADCFIGKKFKDPVPEYTPCDCTWMDYECDAGFTRSQDYKTCEPLPSRPLPDGACKKGDDEYEDVSGFRVIPGDECKNDQKVKKVKRKCPDQSKAPENNGKIVSELNTFKADKINEFYYLERSDSDSGDDETVVLRTNEREVYWSNNHGKSWEKKDEIRDPIIAIYPHRHITGHVYLLTPSPQVYYSRDRGKNIHQFEAPSSPNDARLQILRFHPKEEDWLIWTGCEKERNPVIGSKCKPQAYVSRKNGQDWQSLLRAVGACEFVWREERQNSASKNLVYCVQHRDENMDAPKELLSSKDFFEEKKRLFKDMVNFATMSEYIIVATKTGKDNQFLKVDASIDGEIFAGAKLPSKLKVHHETAYTVLDSSTHAIFLHVTTNNIEDQEYGTIVKSNSNGTSYTLSLQHVNRNTDGYVDFEKMVSLVGTAISNVVANVDELDKGKDKKLKTMITHDDGATWGYIQPPKKDAEDRAYKCGSSKLEECSLHLHGYTERLDPRDSFSSPSAVGLMLGVGNVGDYLLPKRDSNTFISRDGGVTWKTAMNGPYMWEYGDRGAVVVLVRGDKPTNVVYYSLDEGDHWKEYQFSSDEMNIYDISTVPSDTSRNFLLWGTKSGFNTVAATVNLDFSGLATRECKLDLDKVGSEDSDYELWEPKHPNDKENKDNNCLFGKVSQYIRKKQDRDDCYNPTTNFPPNDPFQIKKNCSCTRLDFECDYNFERQSDKDQTCKLATGRQPKDPSAVCEQKGVNKYYEPTGYRRIPLSTCSGGKEMEFLPTKEHACKGKEDDYEKEKGGLSGVGLFFAIVIPVGAAAAIGWWMWRNMEGRFGRIRLGDGLAATSESIARPRGDWTKYPVMAVSGVVAVAMAVPMMFALLWRNAREWIPGGRRSFYSTYGRSGYGEYGNGRAYTSRDGFSRDSGNYSDGPASDERDLLGDESDED